VLAGLGSVDWVVSFTEDTPERLLALLQPDVLVKGGDYDKEGVVGWQIVEAYGGSVYVMSFVDDCSTTSIVEKIQRGVK
jgi:D-beta-D-heptose 7-phosphate kinase/D-beta-D-heptose 1-phosphate adenosyltransferase